MPCWHIDERSRLYVSVNIQIFLLLERWNYFQGVGQDITQSLHELQSLQPPPRRSDLQNKIHKNWVNNVYIYQSVSTICCKHNIHLSLWWLERWHWENMRLLVQNMEPNIFNNGGERILNCIMCGHALSPMNIMK